MGWTLYRYVVLEQAIPSFICYAGLVMILLAGRIMQLTRYIFSSSVTWADIVRIIVLALPKMTLYALPMAMLIGILLAFLRFNNDNELVAIRSAGIGFLSFLPAVLTPLLLTTALAFFISVHVLPAANRSLKQQVITLSRAVLPALLREGIFIDNIPNLVFFFQHVDPAHHRVQGVFLHDARDPELESTIVADRAEIYQVRGTNTILFRIQDGLISRVGEGEEGSQTVRFGHYDLTVSLEEILGGKRSHRKKGEMTLDELRRLLKKTHKRPYALEYHQRLALPFACLFLGLAAAPLGSAFQRGTRMTGITLGIGLFLGYYIFLSAGKALGEEGILPPPIGIWTPNLLSFALALYLWIKVNSETPFAALRYWKRCSPIMARWTKACVPEKRE